MKKPVIENGIRLTKIEHGEYHKMRGWYDDREKEAQSSSQKKQDGEKF